LNVHYLEAVIGCQTLFASCPSFAERNCIMQVIFFGRCRPDNTFIPYYQNVRHRLKAWPDLCDISYVIQAAILPRLRKKLLFCVAPSRRHAEVIMHRLEAEKFTDDHISVVFPNTGALNLPGLGSFIAAGPLIDSLRAVAEGGSCCGIASGLIRLGIDAVKARRCQEKLEGGDFLLSVHTATSEEADRARKVLTDMHAQDVCVSGETDPCALEAN
jgi:hypothetical protein